MGHTQFVCLSGLPRSGSTILSAILDQNPLIHAEGNSAVCQFLWDMHISGTVNAVEQLKASRREHTFKALVKQIPKNYYKDIAPTKKIIVDKCRSWTIPANIEVLRNYIDPNIKIIVLERSLTAIMKSFMKLYKKNNWSQERICEVMRTMLLPSTEPLMRPILGVHMAKMNNANNTFLFIQYDDLVANPAETIQRIYQFCGWEPYPHQFDNIINKHPENDEYYRLEGFHTIRAKLSKEENTIELPPDIQRRL